MAMAVFTPQTSCQHTGPVSLDLAQGTGVDQQRPHLTGLLSLAEESRDCSGCAHGMHGGLKLAQEVKLLNLCLSTEMNSSRMLRPQGCCSSCRSCQGQVSQHSMKLTRCLCSTLLSKHANWSRGPTAARRNHCQQFTTEKWL